MPKQHSKKTIQQKVQKALHGKNLKFRHEGIQPTTPKEFRSELKEMLNGPEGQALRDLGALAETTNFANSEQKKEHRTQRNEKAAGIKPRKDQQTQEYRHIPPEPEGISTHAQAQKHREVLEAMTLIDDSEDSAEILDMRSQLLKIMAYKDSEQKSEQIRALLQRATKKYERLFGDMTKTFKG